jgi:hypothetical protein
LSEVAVSISAAAQAALLGWKPAVAILAGVVAWVACRACRRLPDGVSFLATASLGGLAMLLGGRMDAALTDTGEHAHHLGHVHHGFPAILSFSMLGMLLVCFACQRLLDEPHCPRGPLRMLGVFGGMLAGMWAGGEAAGYAGMVLGMASGHVAAGRLANAVARRSAAIAAGPNG